MEQDAEPQPDREMPPTWHLCWQAAVGREFFPEASLRGRIRDRVIAAHKLRGRELFDFCLLPTELHVVSRLDGGDGPGDLARGIGTVVTRWVREAKPKRSPVLAGPFRAHPIASETELLHEVRMLAWRPVVLGLRRGPTYHRDGGLRVALGRRPTDGYDPRPLLRMFGSTVVGARTALRAWVSKRPSETEWQAWELERGLTLAISGVGPRPWAAHEVRSAEAAALIAAGAEGVDEALQLLTAWVTARLGGPGIVDLIEGADHPSARGRAIVARLATEHALCSSASVARFFGRSKATLSEQMRSSRSRVADNEIVQMPVQRIVAETDALHWKGRKDSRLDRERVPRGDLCG